MRIAFDARHAGRGLGIATFVTELAQALVDSGRHELIWFGDASLAPAGVADCVGIDRLPYPAFDGPVGRRLIVRARADVVHFTGNTGWRVPGPIPSVLTLHDLIFLSTRGRRSLRQMVGHRYERWLIAGALETADVVAVPSETVAAELARRFPSLRAPAVVHQGVTVPTRIEPVPEPAPYIVAFAGRDPRKRTAEVISGWRRLAPLPIGLRLLTAGGLAPELRRELAPDVRSGEVRLLDHLPRQQLWELLAGALALAYPTSDEGFGLPVLEAMAVGTPVLTGLAPATVEVGGDAIVALDARDLAGSIASAVRRLHGDPGYAGAIAKRGAQHAREFSWNRTAERYERLYEAAAQGQRG